MYTAVMKCHTQAGNITTNLKVKYKLPYLNPVKQKLWCCHLYESAKGSYYII